MKILVEMPTAPMALRHLVDNQDESATLTLHDGTELVVRLTGEVLVEHPAWVVAGP